jgi:hypothetical protein
MASLGTLGNVSFRPAERAGRPTFLDIALVVHPRRKRKIVIVSGDDLAAVHGVK